MRIASDNVKKAAIDLQLVKEAFDAAIAATEA